MWLSGRKRERRCGVLESSAGMVQLEASGGGCVMCVERAGRRLWRKRLATEIGEGMVCPNGSPFEKQGTDDS